MYMLFLGMDISHLTYCGDTFRSDLTSGNQRGKSNALYVVSKNINITFQIFKGTSEIKEGRMPWPTPCL